MSYIRALKKAKVFAETFLLISKSLSLWYSCATRDSCCPDVFNFFSRLTNYRKLRIYIPPVQSSASQPVSRFAQCVVVNILFPMKTHLFHQFTVPRPVPASAPAPAQQNVAKMRLKLGLEHFHRSASPNFAQLIVTLRTALLDVHLSVARKK